MEYEAKIINMLCHQEDNPAKHIDYLQPRVFYQSFSITDIQRADIINQIVKIHNTIDPGLRQETLHITVSLFDRVLSMR